MQISWLGDAGIRLQTKDTVILIDPPGAKTGFKPTKQTAHIVCLTQAEFRDASAVGGGPFLINRPGEFEVQNIFVYGLYIPKEAGRLHFRLEAEDLSFGHLGDLNQKLENGDFAQLEGVDILFLPVGGKKVIDADDASTIISQIEPRIVIPIQYHVKGSEMGYGPLEPFLKEVGAKNTDPQEKIKIFKKDLPAEETQFMVLSPQ